MTTTEATAHLRVILGDRHAPVREATRGLLGLFPDLTVVGDAGDGEQLLEMVQRLKPDVLVLDVRLATLDGLEVVRRLKDCAPGTKALIVTAYEVEDYAPAFAKAGASGWLSKSSHVAKLSEAIHSVHAGQPVWPEGAA